MRKLSISIGLAVLTPALASAQVITIGRDRHRDHHRSGASVRLGVPGVSVRTPGISVRTPSVSFRAPGVRVRTPSVRVGVPSVRVRTPSVTYWGPSVRVRTPGVTFYTPGVSVRAPRVRTPDVHVYVGQSAPVRAQPAPPRVTYVRAAPPRAQVCAPAPAPLPATSTTQVFGAGTTFTSTSVSSTRSNAYDHLPGRTGMTVTTRIDHGPAVTTSLPRATAVTRVYVAEPICPNRQPTPVHAAGTGRTTLPRAIPTGRVNPWDATPRRVALSPAQLAEQAAIALHVAFQANDWNTVRRYGLRLAQGELDVVLVEEAFWAQYPSPTLVSQAREGLSSHCTDRGVVLSLRLVLGQR